MYVYEYDRIFLVNIFKNWKVLWILIILLLLVVTVLIKDKTAKTINSFEECQAAGYPVLESYPEQCAVPGGKNFIRDIPDDNITACTMEARECPDGSWVGRTGPNCEFSCP